MGLVTAHWACQRAEDACLVLLSRTGRAQGQTALASLIGPNGNGHVELCKADTSCQVDASELFGQEHRLLSPNVLHAGALQPAALRPATLACSR